MEHVEIIFQVLGGFWNEAVYLEQTKSCLLAGHELECYFYKNKTALQQLVYSYEVECTIDIYYMYQGSNTRKLYGQVLTDHILWDWSFN